MTVFLPFFRPTTFNLLMPPNPSRIRQIFSFPQTHAALAGWLVLGCGILNCGCQKQEDSGASTPGSAAQPAAKVQFATVDHRTFSDKVEALGTVLAFEAIDISPNVTERIAELFFEDGDQVKKGDPLLRLEDTEELAILEGAKVLMAEQEREIQRLESLVAEGAVSEVRIEEYRTQRDLAKQRVGEAQAQIDDRHINAPFDGVLGFRRVSTGALVSPGDLIATLDVLDPIKLDFTVPETFLDDLKNGLEIIAASDAFPDTEFKGTVTQIDTRVNPVTRAVTVRAEIPNSNNQLRPGMLMTTTLENNPSDSLSIPERALMSVQSKNFAFVIDDIKSDSPKVTRVDVKIGRRLPGYVEILEGLTEGAHIVSDGLIGLSDGAAVEIIGEFEAPADAYNPIDPVE